MRAEPRRYRSRVPAREIRFCGLPRLQRQQCRVALRLFGTLSFHASGGAFFACRRERSAFRASRCRSVASRAASSTEPHRSWGTEGSDPAPTVVGEPRVRILLPPERPLRTLTFGPTPITRSPNSSVLACAARRRNASDLWPGRSGRAVIEKGPPPKTRASTSRRADGEVFSSLIFLFRGVHGLRCGALPALRKTRH
jgi:hypothetical protein